MIEYLCSDRCVVENKRVEDLEGMQGKTIVSRAFAPIDKTLFLLSDVISTNWINNPEANEIKNEFVENASCIDAKMYDAFLIT